jgi:phosphatidate phosphatase PAH1
MRSFVVLTTLVLLGCALDGVSPKALADQYNTADCPRSPTGERSKFRHTGSRLISKLGSPRHRGIDVIAVEGDENQTVGGKLAYTKTDKDLEDEDVEIFACVDAKWQSVGSSRTDGDGRFELTLTGAARLPVGLRDLYAHVPGDGSGVRFLSYVAAANESVIVSDVDGTITSSETAVVRGMLGRDIGHQPGAPEVLANSGKVVVYVTARGDQLTEMTRRWLATHGFPRGPLRLAKSMVTLPGASTVTLKSSTLASINVPIAAGIGNRASDIVAYRNAGLTPDRIFINLPEFTGELRDRLAAGEATPFDHYADLRKVLGR